MDRIHRQRDDADVTSARQLAVIVGVLFVLLMGAYIGFTRELRAAPLAFGALAILFAGSRD